jgi:hypothetical protein
MQGRKPLYRPETLKIGQKLSLPVKKRSFGHQYARSFNRRFPPMQFKFIDGLIERIA